MKQNTKTKKKVKFPGVSYDATRKRWRAMLDQEHIGYFKTEYEAQMAVVKAKVDKARAADEAERLRDPDAYFFKEPPAGGEEDIPIECVRDLAMGDGLED
jgi:hypothetical protein